MSKKLNKTEREMKLLERQLLMFLLFRLSFEGEYKNAVLDAPNDEPEIVIQVDDEFSIVISVKAEMQAHVKAGE